jgi:hypothetical protein
MPISFDRRVPSSVKSQPTYYKKIFRVSRIPEAARSENYHTAPHDIAVHTDERKLD